MLKLFYGVSSDMSLSNAQRDGFDRRLSKIKKGGSNTMGEIQIGPRDEESARAGKAKNVVRVKKKRSKNVKLGQGATLSLLPLAGFFGGLSMFVGQAMDYQFFNAGGLLQFGTPMAALEPHMQYAPFVFGGILALLFAWTFRMGGLKFLALAAGFWATFQYQTNLVMTFPGMYAGFFSKEFVEGVFASL